MRYVEHGASVAGVIVLLDDAAVSQRHPPAGELDELGAEGHVEVMQWRLIHVVFSAAPGLSGGAVRRGGSKVGFGEQRVTRTGHTEEQMAEKV